MIELTVESKEDDNDEEDDDDERRRRRRRKRKKINNETEKQTKSCHAVNSDSEFRNWMFFYSLLL